MDKGTALFSLLSWVEFFGIIFVVIIVPFLFYRKNKSFEQSLKNLNEKIDKLIEKK